MNPCDLSDCFICIPNKAFTWSVNSYCMNTFMKRFLPILALGLSLASCSKNEASKPQAQKETPTVAPVVVAPVTEVPKTPEPKVVTEAAAPAAKPSEFAVTDPNAGLGDFGSPEPIERADLPQRGIVSFNMEDHKNSFAPMQHWEQYNLPFKAARSGRYNVRITYTLKSSTLGVQFKLGEDRFKKQLMGTGGAKSRVYLGETSIAQPGDQFMALYTPNGAGWNTFILHDVSLVPASEGEDVKAAEDGSVNLLAKDATTWSQNMRYESKEEKNCLGFWTELEDFAEWEFTVDKPGKYKVTVHQGCGAGGGSEVAVLLGEQQLKFTVQDTGGFQKWAPVSVGEVEIKKGGTYRLAVKPQTKNGSAIMDVQKVVLVPVS